MSKGRTYTELEKSQILKEVQATGNVSTVAKKNDVPVGTIHTWIRVNKKNKKETDNPEGHSKIMKDLKKKLFESDLENKILKDLLKKTYQVWPKN